MKWQVVDVPGIRELAAARLAADPVEAAPTAPTPADPLTAGLSALAAGDLDGAARLLADAAEPAGDGLARAALGDVYAARGDRSAALFAYELAARSPRAGLVAMLGHAATLVATGAEPAALDELRPLRAAHPADATVAHYHALAVLRRADAVRAHTRAGDRVIVSAGQLAECRELAGELAPPELHDPDLRRAAIDLAEQVRTGEVWTWRERGTNAGVLALALLISIGAIGAGGLLGNAAILVAGALVGAAGIFLFVLTHRRPAWELSAQEAAPVVTRRGH